MTGALTGRAASAASAPAAPAIAAEVNSGFATSTSGQPVVCDCTYSSNYNLCETPAVRDAIVAPADAETCSCG